jgi:hypothetical protein
MALHVAATHFCFALSQHLLPQQMVLGDGQQQALAPVPQQAEPGSQHLPEPPQATPP